MFCCGRMATPDSGDSNQLPNEPRNEVCVIINCVAIYYEKGAITEECLLSERKVPSTGLKDTEVAQSFERNFQVCLLFRPCKCIHGV